ncbi:MAG TPA: hypothetical protein PLD20_16735 [Blastocatellia bacterium]|nr:hypothetical protein [Blastocatellia bacterium]HMZ19585.1 hypothetical protein [Blastocatellia bacterium]
MNATRPFTIHQTDGNFTPSITQRLGRAIERTQRNAREIEQLPFDLSALEDEGLFVNVDATGFGLLDRRLDWQALGVQLPTETDVNFTPPRCGLLPNRYRRPLLTPVSQAHTALHKYSYQFRLTETLFETPAYRWVPWRAFEEFERAFQQACEHLDAARQKVLNDYDEIRTEVLATFRQVAADSIQRLEATGAEVPEDFKDRLVRNVLASFPTEEELHTKLSLRFQVGVILLGSEMLREQRLAARERQQLEQVWQAQEQQHLRLVAEQDEQRREAEIKERIRQMKLDAAREKLQETLSPLQEGAAQLRSQIYDAAAAMREALQKHDFVPGATAKKARNLTRWFRLMNFSSDAELDQLLGQLDQLTQKSTGKTKQRSSNAAVKAVLDEIVQVCAQDVQALGQTDRLAALEF